MVMNYYGSVLSEKVDSDSIYVFLRKSMCRVNEDRPFRGPKEFKEGDFVYTDYNEGDISRFRGTEKIFFKGEEVYRLEYHGGNLR